MSFTIPETELQVGNPIAEILHQMNEASRDGETYVEIKINSIYYVGSVKYTLTKLENKENEDFKHIDVKVIVNYK